MSFFGQKSNDKLRQAKSILPDLPLNVPLEMVEEIGWTDFSNLANPLGTPQGIINAMISALQDGDVSLRPDRDAMMLRQCISSFYEIPSDSVLPGCTPAQLIYAASQAFRSTRVGLAAPCSMEIELAVTNAGHDTKLLRNPYSLVTCDYEAAKSYYGDFNAVVLGNPLFPTSRLLPESVLIGYVEHCDWVIVDESLIELSLGGVSMVPLTERYQNLIVVRNPSYTFAMPGTPIAYMVGHPKTIRHIKQFYDSSAISMFAEVLSKEFLQNLNFLDETQEFIENEIPWLHTMISLIPGMSVYPSEANFLLCSYSAPPNMKLGVQTAEELENRLQFAGYQVPRLKRVLGLDSEDYFLVAVHDRATNRDLVNAMRQIITGHSI